MTKRKKHPKLPNGYGTIRYLGGNRRNPYAVQPPTREFRENGSPITPKALCYVDDWYVGFAVLNAYHAGTYTPGDEIKFKQVRPLDDRAVDEFCRRLLADHMAQAFVKADTKKKTFAEVYDLFYDWKYGENAKKKLSIQSQQATRAAFKNCSTLHNRAFEDLRHRDLQECIDGCPLKSSSIENMVSLIKQMYKYAILYEICDRNYSGSLSAPAQDDEHGVPFSDDELKILWKNQEDPTVEFLLIMCYSGYRITAYKTLEVNTEEWYFRGGIKTAAGKDRIVPIHSAIQPLVARRMGLYDCLLKVTAQTFRNAMYGALRRLRIENHTPHDCRHTFSRLCEKYGVNENDRKRMMGHSFGADITNAVYGHRTLDELRAEIEKIKV